MKKKEEKEHPKRKPNKAYRFLKILGKVFLGILIFLLLVVLFVRSPWGQDIIVNKAVSYISDKTNTKVEIEKLFITFDGDILLKGLYLEDKKGDTLIYSRSLEADVPLWPIIRGNGIGVEAVDWSGVRANIIRKDTVAGYNFQFLLDAFAAADTTAVQQNTTAAPMEIILGDITLHNFNVVYNDAVLGIESHYIVEDLYLEMEKTDLEAMEFRASEGTISNARIIYIQTPVPVDPNAEPPPLPFLAIDELTLKNVFADYQSVGDGIAAHLEIIDLFAEVPKADLLNNKIEIGNFNLKRSIITITAATEENAVTQEAKEAAQTIKEEVKAFEWPAFRISIAELNLQENSFSYLVNNEVPQQGIFNPNAIVLRDLTLVGNDLFLKNKRAGFALEVLSFEEASGLLLKEFSFNTVITDTRTDVEDLVLHLNDNRVEGELHLEYEDLEALVTSPETSEIALQLPSFQVDLKEVFKFQPQLKNNEYL